MRVRASEALGSGDLVGHLLLGPTCPVERADAPCDPVARPAPVVIVALDASGSEVTRATTRSDGSFALSLPPGEHMLHAEPSTSGYPRITDSVVSVPEEASLANPLRVTLSGDTGIR